MNSSNDIYQKLTFGLENGYALRESDFDLFFDAIKKDFELEPRDLKCDYLVKTHTII
mgnify:CR=1 FL=1